MANFTFKGSNADDTILTGTNGQDILLTDGLGNVLADVVGVDSLLIDTKNGNDTINASALPAGLTQLTIDGGSGNDTIIGSQGADTLIGGDGDDVVTAGAAMTSRFWVRATTCSSGTRATAAIRSRARLASTRCCLTAPTLTRISTSRPMVRGAMFTRDVANVTMDLNGVEKIEFHALGGADNIVVNDLSGTDVKQVAIDLSCLPAAAPAMARPIRVTVNGTAGNDKISVGSGGTGLLSTGLSAHGDRSTTPKRPTTRLIVNGGGGDDIDRCVGAHRRPVKLTIDGGAGNDTITGSQGADMLLGGTAMTSVTGGRGNDVALLGSGDDVFIWNPGDGSDIVEGQAGTDTLLFNGANISENIDISANGSRALLTRDVANVTMDLNGVERSTSTPWAAPTTSWSTTSPGPT